MYATDLDIDKITLGEIYLYDLYIPVVVIPEQLFALYSSCQR
jgi:hypothetical protein